jgi:hypothetical protein
MGPIEISVTEKLQNIFGTTVSSRKLNLQRRTRPPPRRFFRHTVSVLGLAEGGLVVVLFLGNTYDLAYAEGVMVTVPGGGRAERE